MHNEWCRYKRSGFRAIWISELSFGVCVPVFGLCTCIRSVCLYSVCVPVFGLCACIRSVYLYSFCVPVFCLCACSRSVCLYSVCVPVFGLCACIRSVCLYSVCVPVFVQRAGTDLNLFRKCKSVLLTTSAVQLPTEFRIIMYINLLYLGPRWLSRYSD